MNELGGYEGTDNNDELLDRLVPRIGVQARALVEQHKTADDLVIVVVFQPHPDCRAAHLADVIAMMDRRGEEGIAKTLRTERLGIGEYWLAIQREGGVIVMARLRIGEVDAASLLN